MRSWMTAFLTTVLLTPVQLATAAAGAPATPDAAPPATAAAEREAILARLLALEKEVQELKERLARAEAAEAPAAAPSEAAALADFAAAAAAAAAAAPATPAPITLAAGAGNKSYLNLSLDALIAAGGSTAAAVGDLQLGGHDPAQRGFTVQNVEIVFDAAVDPYFRGQANVVMQVDPEGETVVELEEAYATTTSLPHGLQLKAGQFLSEFGRLNPSHPHSWDFADQPLVSGRFFGGDGLRSVGARLSWLLPTRFYSEAYLTVQNSQGETLPSFRSVPGERLFGREIGETKVAGLADLLIVPRYAASFDLSDTQTLLVGASAALGPNGSGDDGRTRIWGVDAFWKWKSPTAFQGFPFFKVQGEWLRREVDAAATADLPAATFADWGTYLQASWGYKTGRVLGLRLDRVGGDQGDGEELALARRWRVSPAFTYFVSEYSKLRLQYNFDRFDELGRDEHSWWLQLEFLLGAHAAHKF